MHVYEMSYLYREGLGFRNAWLTKIHDDSDGHSLCRSYWKKRLPMHLGVEDPCWTKKP